MEARIDHAGRRLASILVVTMLIAGTQSAWAQRRGGARSHDAQSDNFIVFASSPEWAQQVSRAAEKYRSELAAYWLGHELPSWSRRCPIHVHAAPNLGAGGETSFLLNAGRVGNWAMSVQGTPERILDSVLPHEITHTIFATHFAPLNKYVPRWADEGACTTVEHEAEKRKHRKYLTQFLKTGRGLAFNKMFGLKEYPADILPLYAQGHSAVQFLIDQGDARRFVTFLEDGMRTENWTRALHKHYAYESVGEFQTSWNAWLRQGSPDDLLAFSPLLQARRGEAEQIAAAEAESGSSPIRMASAQESITRPASNDISGDLAELSSDPQSLGLESSTAGGQSAEASPDSSTLAAAEPSDGGRNSESDTSWYSRRLREVSGGPATDFPPHNVGAAPRGGSPGQRPQPSGARQVLADSRSEGTPRTTAQPPRAQSNQVRVLEWGGGGPVGGIERGNSSTAPAVGGRGRGGTIRRSLPFGEGNQGLVLPPPAPEYRFSPPPSTQPLYR